MTVREMRVHLETLPQDMTVAGWDAYHDERVDLKVEHITVVEFSHESESRVCIEPDRDWPPVTDEEYEERVQRELADIPSLLRDPTNACTATEDEVFAAYRKVCANNADPRSPERRTRDE